MRAADPLLAKHADALRTGKPFSRDFGRVNRWRVTFSLQANGIIDTALVADHSPEHHFIVTAKTANIALKAINPTKTTPAMSLAN